jgi:biopolymer transport protein ExbD
MSGIELKPANEGKTKRRLPKDVRIDMTPMVDLGFLLITFFIFTTTMAEEKAMSLAMPKTNTLDSSELKESNALTVLLSKENKVFVYEGRWESALKNNRISVSNYNEAEGIGKSIRLKQEWLEEKYGKGGKDSLVILYKPASGSSYKNLIDAIDEALINAVKKYVVVDPSKEEISFMEVSLRK